MKRFYFLGLFTFKITCTIISVILIFASKVHSQTQEWKLYSTSNSKLPHNYAIRSKIDPQGNIWICTSMVDMGMGGGLAKFDGDTTWAVYNTSNSGLPSNNVMDIAFDNKGNKWIGTYGGGLVKFDGDKSWKVYKPSNSPIPWNLVWFVTIDNKENIWIGTEGGGLAKYDGDTTWTVYNTSNSGLPFNMISDLAFDAKGNIWIATCNKECGYYGGGLAKFDGDTTWKVYNKANSGLPSNDVWKLAFDEKGNLWIGTLNDLDPSEGGLAKFDLDTTWTIYNKSNSPLPLNNVVALTFDDQGNLWTGLWGLHDPAYGALVFFDGKDWKIYDRNNVTNGEFLNWGVMEIEIDTYGNKWLGTFGGGLGVYNENGIITRAGHTNISCTSQNCFLHASNDSLNIVTKLINTDHHNFSAKAIFSNNDCKIFDSTILYDDGFHGDLEANDNNWGTYIHSISEKDYFNVGISIFDKQTGEYSKRCDWTRFTTVGPISIDSFSIKNANNLYYAKPYIHNQDNTATIINVSVKLICNDSWVISISPQSKTLPDINSGSTVTTSTSFIVNYEESQFPGYFNFKVEILSNDWTYWEDSIKMVVTGIESKNLLPLTFELNQNYPNPFNPSTVISYQLPVNSQVSLKVYDILGNEVVIFVDEEKPAGTNEVEFDGSKLSSGIYFYQLKAENYYETKKMILLK
jgi:sugar lactone lactonase YvrE